MILLNFATFLENQSKKIKKHIRRKAYKKFQKKYNIEDSPKTKKTIREYNPYERTDLLLIEELIKSNYILRDDNIVDIGCGTGIFICYLATKGFKHLLGIEINESLIGIAESNIKKIKDSFACDLAVYHCDALRFNIPDDANCFYLFNTFYSKETYLLWLDMLKESMIRRNRTVRIIILFPTISSMSAISACEWITEIDRVISKSQACWRCVNFMVYEAKI